MSGKFRTLAFRAAVTMTTILIVTVVTAMIWVAIYQCIHPSPPEQRHLGSLITVYASLYFISLLLFSGVFFGWRLDRRDMYELRRQIAGLRLLQRDELRNDKL